MNKKATPEELAKVVQTEKIGLNDFLISFLIGIAVFVFQTLWQLPGPAPEHWQDMAVATGLYPAYSVVPGYWVSLAGWLYKATGVTLGTTILQYIGHAVIAVITMIMYGVLREVLTFIMRARPQSNSKWRKTVMRIAAAIAALSFACSDAVWSAGQFFSETTLLLLLTVLALQSFFTFLRKGQLKYSYLCALALGVLTAETPAGFFLVVTFIALNFIVLNILPNMESPFFKPELIEVGKWHMTFIYLVALLGGIGFNAVMYMVHDGLVPGGESFGSIPLSYLLDYFHRLTAAAPIFGWVLLLGASIAPFVISIVRFPDAADEERFLSYSTGIVFLFCGIVAFSQCASLPALWFWTYVPVHSQYLLTIGSVMLVMTVATAVTVLGVDSLCRDHRKLSRQLFGVDADATEGEEMVMSQSLTDRLRALGIIVVPLMLLAALVPGRVKSASRAMLALVEDVISATIDEAGDATRLFTDGNLDAGVEVESLRRGRPLYCIALMGGGPNQIYLRTRGTDEDPEDAFSFQYDGGMGLRSWIRDKPEKLKSVAVQVGFDLWKRDGKPLPPMGGLLSRPTMNDSAELAARTTIATNLAARAISIFDSGIKDCTDTSIKKAFFDAEWRLARMSIYRAESHDLAGDALTAIADMALAKALNDRNETFKSLLKATERRNEQMMQRLTPREGLQLALVRADFRLGKVYAETILGADPENPDANFALGMFYESEKQYSRAEEYLIRCLIRRPNEPAVYNNLAMIEIVLGKLEAAEVNAKKALQLIPGSAAVLDTLAQIEKMKQEKK